MPTFTSHAPGSFCWLELCSTDLAAARRFYPTLFGWTTRDVPIPGGVYVMCQREGHEVAAMYQMSDADRAQGIPSHWFTYIAVANVDETTMQVPALGGTVDAGPFDVSRYGRMAVVKDPTGGHVGLWQAMDNPGVGVRDEPGSLCWTELMTRDRATAAAFFGRLIGWEASSMAIPDGEYTVFMGEGVPKAGCMQITPEMGDVPTGWLTYFAVADCEATVARVGELGGALLKEPESVPGVGRWALCQDTSGGVFAVIAPIEP
jgi:predicted enzyme related to lactoylglutathione lyase